jgi:hypothetical protein
MEKERQLSPGRSGGDAEVQKVFFQSLDRSPDDAVAVKDIADLFTQAKQFSQPARSSPLRIFDGQIQKLEHPLKSLFKPIGVATLEGSGSALKLASDVAELFVDREGEPAAVFEGFVYQRFHFDDNIFCHAPDYTRTAKHWRTGDKNRQRFIQLDARAS